MKFMMMGLERRGEWEQLPQTERDVRIGRHQQALQELVMERDRAGANAFFVASVGLGPAAEATTVRFRNGTPSVTDGPFIETKEVLAGFDVIDFSSQEEAVEFCKKRCIHDGHVSEIRPVHQWRWVYHGAGRGDVTKFALLIANDEAALSKLSEPEIERGAQHHGKAALEYVTERGLVRSESLSWCGVRLRRTTEAATLRWTDGKALLADGPFAETKEVVGGVCVIDCASKREAIDWAQKLSFRERDVIEVRPVHSMWWIYYG
jgi:hypothetical protein